MEDNVLKDRTDIVNISSSVLPNEEYRPSSTSNYTIKNQARSKSSVNTEYFSDVESLQQELCESDVPFLYMNENFSTARDRNSSSTILTEKQNKTDSVGENEKYLLDENQRLKEANERLQMTLLQMAISDTVSEKEQEEMQAVRKELIREVMGSSKSRLHQMEIENKDLKKSISEMQEYITKIVDRCLQNEFAQQILSIDEA
ncbi:Schizosaccharomyces specific protein, expressed during meiotic cell cycle [Schizosaccharomyces osmophilus]|uniref:Schizosaccharomyces specific protein, expressed during meiotic cell cycle n=1 Tax=Schizosaccharomyces osmophilus TaxID=2545709 RepID=A0AAE9WBI6_9SCHI|nr:Schizosaccharomyces specific protein, expressed during meiotic cell cycle [Schizosaccharomyces osmophilus]WBW72850.1 Schizosaccharomyces specific protein, expressed during meiotic cell cycle [Schizosaccharomyces osmophilus]